MNCSKQIKYFILSFYPIKTKLFLISHTKALQKLNYLSLEHYKIVHELQFSIDDHSNMALYYDYYISKYPSINIEPLKDIILYYLSEYSKENEIHIDNVHPFSVDIANTIPQNIVLDIISFQKHNPLMNIKNNTNIKRINIYPENPTLEEITNLCNNINQLYVKEMGFTDKILSYEIEEFLSFHTNIEVVYYDSFIHSLILKEEYNLFLLKEKGGYSSIKYSKFLTHTKNQNKTQTINYDKVKTLVVRKKIETFPIIPNLETLTIELSDIITANNIYSINYPKLKTLNLNTSIPVDFLLYIINRHKTIENLTFNLDSTKLTDFSKILLSKLLNSIPTVKNISVHFSVVPKTISDDFWFSFNNLKKIQSLGIGGIDIGKLLNKNKNITNLIVNQINRVSEIKDYDYSKLRYIYFSQELTNKNIEGVQFMINCVNLRNIIINKLSYDLLSIVIDNLYKFKYLKVISIANIIGYEKVFDVINSITKCSFIQNVSLNIEEEQKKENNEGLILSILNCFKKCPFFSSLTIKNLRFSSIDKKYLIDNYITSKKVVVYYNCSFDISLSKLCFLPQ